MTPFLIELFLETFLVDLVIPYVGLSKLAIFALLATGSLIASLWYKRRKEQLSRMTEVREVTKPSVSNNVAVVNNVTVNVYHLHLEAKDKNETS